MTVGRAPELAEAGRRGRHRAAPRRPHLKATAGRLSWGLVDQAVSSMTNFAVGIYVARSLGVTAFGIFSVAWVTYGVVLNIGRGLATDPLMVRFSGVAPEAWRAAVARSSGTALRVGLLAGLVCLLAGVAMGGELGWAFIALGLILPGLLLQDSWRFAFFAAGNGRKACANDAVWAAALIPAMILASQHGNVLAFVLAWGIAGTVAALYGIVQTGIRPQVTGVGHWLRQQRDLGTRYLIENVSSSGSAQIRLYGLGALAGLADVGTVRGAELLLGPFLAVLMGLSLVTVAEAARVRRRSPHRLKLFCGLLGGGQAAAAMAWGAALLLLLPDRVGELVLGEVWHSASALIVPATLSVMGASFTTGAASGLRALGQARRSLRSQLIASAMYIVGGLAGAWAGGALGSSWGVATATWLGAVVWWLQLQVGLREEMRTR
jgi:O-antigen/teichoic acid export membrane protein